MLKHIEFAEKKLEYFINVDYKKLYLTTARDGMSPLKRNQRKFRNHK